MSRRFLIAVLALVLSPLTAVAQDYPSKPIKMIVPWAAGGPTDSIGRVLTQKMGEQMPYKGGDPSLQALLAGETKMSFVDLSIAGAHAAAGRLRPLAVSTTTRAELMPDLPTLAEAGLPGFESMTTFAMFVPAGTPPEVIARLNREVNKALATPEVKKWLLGQGVAGVGGTPEDLAKHQAADSAKWGKVIKEQEIKFE